MTSCAHLAAEILPWMRDLVPAGDRGRNMGLKSMLDFERGRQLPRGTMPPDILAGHVVAET